MFRQARWSAVLIVGAAVLLSFPVRAHAQDKAAPKTMQFTTSSTEARQTLSKAVAEVENIAGARRYDALLKSAVDADPKFALARAYYAQWNSTLAVPERQKELNQAVRDAADASLTEMLVVLALREWRAGHGNEARSILDGARNIMPDDPHILYMRQLFAANAADGIAIGEAATKRFSEFAPPYNTLAYQLNNAGRQQDAIATVEKYVSLAPDHPNSHDSHAEILSFAGRYDESDAEYQRALQLDPTWEAAHEGMAENAFKRGRPADARAHLQESLKAAETPQRTTALLREITATYVAERNVNAAIQQLNTAIKVNESVSLAAPVRNDRRSAALFLAAQGRTAEALKQYEMTKEPTPAPLTAVTDAIFYTVTGRASDVSSAAAAMAKSASAAPENNVFQEAMHLTQMLDAVAHNDVATAQQHLAAVKLPVLRALGAAALVKPLNSAHDKAGAATAMATVDAYKDLNINNAIARVVATRK